MLFRSQAYKLLAYCALLCDYKCQEIRDFAPGHCRAGKLSVVMEIFWFLSQRTGLLFCLDYESNLQETDLSVHPLCLQTLCELCSLGCSSVTHLCMCEKKDILLLRWWVRGDSFCYSIHNGNWRVLCSPSTFTSPKAYCLVHRSFSGKMSLGKEHQW